jgi:hypothetical protein
MVSCFNNQQKLHYASLTAETLGGGGGMMSSSISFSRKPDVLTSYKDGERRSITRRPPPKVHDIWPQDVVQLSKTKSPDFKSGDKATVTHVNPQSAQPKYIASG